MTLKEQYDSAVESIDILVDGIIEINDKFHIQVGEANVTLVEKLQNGNFKFYPTRSRSFEMVEQLYEYALQVAYYQSKKQECVSCRYHVIDSDKIICDFPLIPEKFHDGVIDENPTNMSNGGAMCKRYERIEKQVE